MLKIYHNPRCKKSREGLEILKNSGKDFEVREYLKEPLSEEELKAVVKKLDITPILLVRKNEKIWKKDYREKDLSDSELIRVMVKNPKLIERPIVENENDAIIGRPPAEIEKII
ncbi:arsenate reductase (glutaredoxin) [Christiangramia salexigens]|uniref:Arsenate reductase (Glutaredoxin) n=1 Tax=Christiangramia salexigens TaxID=1913577 RepID=A0A1L3J2U2_9FLAO|nr:arsenate reductase (glutaredoxin) [Christiangramia salexigens]APG59440.1 arsenate reductase (glutaredoxin) [Christiangramia salexigens]